MALRISDLDTRTSLSKNDWFEVEGYSDRASGKVSGAQIAALCKTQNNGGFYGRTTKSLDEFTYADTGVYWWEGTPALSGMPSTGILEIISSAAVDDTLSANETPTFIQRLTNGANVYTRMVSGSVTSPWGILKNVNGNKILSGVSADGSVNFNTIANTTASNPFFNQTPVLTITPFNSNPNSVVCIANIQSIDQNGFSVARFQSSTQAVIEDVEENTTVEEYESQGSVPKHTKTTTTKSTQPTRGAWEAGDFPYYWIATVDG